MPPHDFISQDGTKVVINLDENVRWDDKKTAFAIHEAIEERAKQVNQQRVQLQDERENPARTAALGFIGGVHRGVLQLATVGKEIPEALGLPGIGPSFKQAEEFFNVPKRPLSGIGKGAHFVGDVFGSSFPGATIVKGTAGALRVGKGVGFGSSAFRSALKGVGKRVGHVGKKNLAIAVGTALGSEGFRTVSPFEDGSAGDIFFRLVGGAIGGRMSGGVVTRVRSGVTSSSRRPTTGIGRARRFISGTFRSVKQRGPTRGLKRKLTKVFEGLTPTDFRKMLISGDFSKSSLPVDLIPLGAGSVKSQIVHRLRNLKQVSPRLSNFLTSIATSRDYKLSDSFRGIAKDITGQNVDSVHYDIRNTNKIIREAGESLMEKLLDPILKGRIASDLKFDWAFIKLESGLKLAKSTKAGRADILSGMFLTKAKDIRAELTANLFNWGLKIDINQNIVEGLITHVEDELGTTAPDSESSRLLHQVLKTLTTPVTKKLPLSEFLEQHKLPHGFGMKDENDVSGRTKQDRITDVDIRNIKRPRIVPGQLPTASDLAQSRGPGQKAEFKAVPTVNTPIVFVDDRATMEKALAGLGPEGHVKLSADGRNVIFRVPGSNGGLIWSVDRDIRARLNALEKTTPESASQAKGKLKSTLDRLRDVLYDRHTKVEYIPTGAEGQFRKEVTTTNNNKRFHEAMDTFTQISEGIEREYAVIKHAKELMLKEAGDVGGLSGLILGQRKDAAGIKFDKDRIAKEREFMDFQAASKLTDDNIGGLMKMVLEMNNPEQTGNFMKVIGTINPSAPAKVLAAILNLRIRGADGFKVAALRRGGPDAPQVDGATYFKQIIGDPRTRENMSTMVEHVSRSFGNSAKSAKEVVDGFNEFMDILSGTVDFGEQQVVDEKSTGSITTKVEKHLNGLTPGARARNGNFLIEVTSSKRGHQLMQDLASGRGGLSGKAEIIQQLVNFTRQRHDREERVDFTRGTDKQGRVLPPQPPPQRNPLLGSGFGAGL